MLCINVFLLVHNLFALIGRKAPFTHSLTHLLVHVLISHHLYTIQAIQFHIQYNQMKQEMLSIKRLNGYQIITQIYLYIFKKKIQYVILILI